MVACSMIVCIRATVRTSWGGMSVTLVGKNSIGRRQRCVIDVLSQQMVWLLLHSQPRYSGHWRLNENAISRPTRSSTRVRCLTEHHAGGPLGRRKGSAFEHYWRMTGYPEVIGQFPLFNHP